MKIEHWKIDEIIPYENNPRINDGAVEKTAMSIREYGWQQPIVVDTDGIIIVGHTRLKAAQSMSLEECPVHVAENLTEAQVKAYRIADNKTGEIAKWDQELLNLEIKDLVDLDFDIELTGFNIDEFDSGLSFNDNQGNVGYPWETVQTARKDAMNFGRLFDGINEKYNRGRLMAAMHLTPFSPEPLTPMEHTPANIDINWRRCFGGKSYPLINNERINVFIGPYTTTAPTLSRRVMINRCKLDERGKIFNIVTSKLEGIGGIEIGRKVSDFLGRDIFGWQVPGEIVPFLKSYSDHTKISLKLFPN